MNIYRVVVALTAVVISALLLSWLLGKNPDEQLQEIVYVDSVTGEAFLLKARSSPEYNPVTGDPTLIPGMYCNKCQAWKAVGPLEMLQSNRIPQTCPIHKTSLLREGPLPDEP